MSGRDVIQRQIREIFFREVVSAVIKKIVTKIPFLGFPVIGWIFATGVEWLAGKFWDELKVYGIFLEIDIKEGVKLYEYNEASDRLKKIISKVDNREIPELELQRAKDEYKEKLRNLIRMDVDTN